MNKSKSEKFLHIQFTGNLIEVLKEYCKKVGIGELELGNAIGLLIAITGENINLLTDLNKLFFYSGIYFAMEHKNKLKYEYKSQSDTEQLKKEISKGLSYIA